MYPRISSMTPEAAQQLADSFYSGIAKLRAHFFAARFDNIYDPQNPLIVFPPKGVGASTYKEALLRRTEFESPEAIVAADLSIKAKIRSSFEQSSGKQSERTIARLLVGAINTTSAYNIQSP